MTTIALAIALAMGIDVNPYWFIYTFIYDGLKT